MTIGALPAFAAPTDPMTVKGPGVNITYTNEEILALTQAGPLNYSNTNSAGTTETVSGLTGVTVETFLEAAGINTAALEPNRAILFWCGSMSFTLTWENVIQPRYQYDTSGNNIATVPTMISFNYPSAPGDAPRLVFGQLFYRETTRNSWLKNVDTIEIGSLTEPWNPATPSLTPGSTVTPGQQITLTPPSGGPSYAMSYYTIDGSEPTGASPFFSTSPFAANTPITVPANDGSGKFVIKTKTMGTGSGTSSTATFTYFYPFAENTAFLTGPDEVNIDLTDEIEYTVNVANVTDANMFQVKLAYDADKLTYKDMDALLPSSFAPWVLDFNNDSFNGEIEFILTAGAKGEAFTSSTAAEIAALQFTLKSGVVEDDVIEADLISVSVINPVIGTAFDATIAGDGVSTLVVVNEVDPLLKYDINNDGVFDLVDLAIIIYRYFMVDETEALWSEASLYNISTGNAVQVIDTADIIALYSLIEAQG